MPSVSRSLHIIQHRLSHLPDAVLADIAVSPAARDIVCQTTIGYRAAQEVDYQLDFNRANQQMTLLYHPLYEETSTQDFTNKRTGHEIGHGLLHLSHPRQTTLRSSLDRIATYSLPAYLAGSLPQAHTMKRRAFLRKAFAIYVGSQLPYNKISQDQEWQADRIADALYPEVTIGDMLADDNRIRPYTTLETWRESSVILTTHPADAARAAVSQTNCQAFQKNALYW
jgi:hypothetical protein